MRLREYWAPLWAAARRRPRLSAGLCVALVLCLLVLRSCRRGGAEQREYYDSTRVRRGPVHFVLRESGTLSPREPILVKSVFNGTLQWIIEDGAWVHKGEKLFVVSEEDELQRVTERRNDLVNARHELRLARARRAHAAELEARKLKTARRNCELEQIRYRILTTTPKGGTELVRLHEQLVPLEKETNEVRARYEHAQDAYQLAQDAYLDALDAWQAARDKILQTQTRIDEYRAELDEDPERMQAHALVKREQTVKKLTAAEQAQTEARAAIPGLQKKLEAARQARERMRVPRDEIAGTLRAREEQEKEIYIQLEIEKRGVPLAQLQLDEKAARLSLQEAQRKLESGRKAFEAGSISRAALDALEAAVKTAESRLRIVEQKVKIAAAPLPPEALAEARMKRERAEAAAANAQQAHDRALKILDTEIRMFEARLQRLSEDIDYRSRSFPAIIESNLAFARKEMELLDQDETQRRQELETEIARLEQELAEAQKNPPNVATALVDGIAHVRFRGDRPLQAGDAVREEDVNVRLYPPENMEVRACVNEVNLRRVRRGMPVRVFVPALAKRLDGQIYQIAGVGKDKLEAFSRWNRTLFADVTEFDIRVQLTETTPEFRQGMTVMVEILIEEKPDVLWLPIGAVQERNGKYAVLTGRRRAPRRLQIEGVPFAEDTFIVSSGLAEDDAVYLPRVRNL